jgi:hypothetical protein
MSQEFDSKSQKGESLASLAVGPSNWREKFKIAQTVDPTSEPKETQASGRDLLEKDLKRFNEEMSEDKKERIEIAYGGKAIPNDDLNLGYLAKEPDPFEAENDRYVREKLDNEEDTNNYTFPVSTIAGSLASSAINKLPEGGSVQKAANKIVDSIPEGVSADVDTNGTVSVGYRFEW